MSDTINNREPMPRNAFVMSSAGVKVPRLVYGTAWKKERTAELVVDAVQAGFRGIDTACQPRHYAEEAVGEALRTLKQQGLERKALYLQTKFTPVAGQDPNSIPYDKEAPLADQVTQSFARSQQNLQTDYVDSFILHTPLFPFAHLLTVWRAMERLYKNGGTRQLGISNCYDLDVLQRLYHEADIKPALVQNRFYDESGYDTELRQWCREKGIIYQSFWSLTANPHILASETLSALAIEHGRTAAQLFFAFLMAVGIVPLTGTTSQKHMAEDLKAMDITLPQKAVKAIQKLLV